MESFKVGVNVSGTFTDIVFIGSNGTLLTKKIPTPSDFSKAVVNSLGEILSENKLSRESIVEILHSTPVVIDTIVEKRGGKAGLITTRGFRDVLSVGRGTIPISYDLSWKKPAPPIPRYLVAEVDESIDGKGNVICPLDVNGAIAAIDKLACYGAESIAVCLLNSPHNPVHEQKIGQLLRERVPKVHVSLSTEVIPMIKEAERSFEVAVNAYLMPVVTSYLKSLTEGLASIKIKAPVYVMQSCGGMTALKEAADKPVALVLGGPAGGVVGCRYIANKLGIADIITLDMEGTSAKASIIADAKSTLASEYEVGAKTYRANRLRTGSGCLLRTPAIDIFDLWCSCDSIAWLDSGGVLHVGPQTAATEGEAPTLTDAYVVLGYLNPHKLSSRKSYQLIEDKIAKPLGIETAEAAYIVYEIANSNISRIIAAVCAEKGKDTHQFVLFAFGAAGAIAVVEIGRALGMKKVIVPPNPGIFDALGLFFADIERHFIHPFKGILDKSIMQDIKDTFETMISEAISSVGKWGYTGAKVNVERYVNLRYCGQTAEVTLNLPDEVNVEQLSTLIEKFNQEHLKLYNFSLLGRPLEVTSLKIIARIPLTKPMISVSKPSPCLRTQTMAYFGKGYGLVSVPVLGVEQLAQGTKQGPLIIESYDSTIVVPPSCDVTIGEWGSIVITI